MRLDGLSMVSASDAMFLKVQPVSAFPTSPVDGTICRLTQVDGEYSPGLYFWSEADARWVGSDITSVSSGTGLTGGGNSGTITVSLDTSWLSANTATSWSSVSGKPTTLSGFGISDGQSLTLKNQPNGYVGLNSSVKINPSVLPNIAIRTTYIVADEAAMLALPADTGDIAVRTDESKSYILKGSSASTLSDWQVLKTPGLPTLATVAYTGDYNDLSNKPAAYSLPIATASTRGGIKAGSDFQIDGTGLLNFSGLVRTVNGQTGAAVLNFTNMGSITGMPYDIVGCVEGTPVGNEVLHRILAPRSFSLPVDLNGAYVKCGTAPSTNFTIYVKKNADVVGTINFAAGSTTATFTLTGGVVFEAGDRFSLVCQDAESTIADIDFALYGSVQ